MKKHQISELVSRFATPVVLLVLGLVLIFCPDTASALISKVVGWGLLMAGIIVAVAMVVDSDWSVSKVLTVLALVILGRWLMTHPLAWAAWGGRIIGLLLLLRGIRDFTQSVFTQGKVLSVVTAVLGLVLILLPMTASRMMFSLCGFVILAVGGGMLAERIWENKNGEDHDPNIIDAL
ncbi:MAG: DUF308 domain-containing protein [Clostridiales bacterium]|nr:DUF308 domain-containing protein [Clostridiales bacterium]